MRVTPTTAIATAVATSLMLVMAINVSACFPKMKEIESGDAWTTPSSSAFGPKVTPPPPTTAPDFKNVVNAAKKPPPLSGGTLAISHDGTIAVASDPDRDHIFVVDLVKKTLVRDIILHDGDEPGRIVEDNAGRFHVALRGGGAVFSFDRSSQDGTSTTDRRRATCPAPRGIALDPSSPRLIVACEGGELAALSTTTDDDGAASSTIATLDHDLRDVVVTSDRIYVSTFRSARILEVSPTSGALFTSSRLPAPDTTVADEPMLAFRMIAAPSGSGDTSTTTTTVVVHEAAHPGALPTVGGTYYSVPNDNSVIADCRGGSVVASVVSRIGSAGGAMYLPAQAVLPVDVAIHGDSLAVIAAGNGHTHVLPQLYVMKASSAPWSDSPCGPQPSLTYPSSPSTNAAESVQLTSVAFRDHDHIVVQSREPAALVLLPEGVKITLSTESREDTGHAVFHSNTGRGAACASCHAEGGDDGHVWTFSPQGQRRTPSLRGTLNGTAPFHWDGSEENMAQLTNDVYSTRMGGITLDASQETALEDWLYAIPPPKPSVPSTDAMAQRGSLLFRSSAVGCASCHAGAKLTSNESVDVGTGGKFQIPSLIGVGARTPLMHNGCASVIRERFSTSCGGANHGNISHLSPTDLDDLTAYLESL